MARMAIVPRDLVPRCFHVSIGDDKLHRSGYILAWFPLVVRNPSPSHNRYLTMSSSLPDKVTENLPSTTEVKEATVEATKSSLESLRSLASGGVGGVCAVLVGHPFDLVKVRLQTAESGVYKGALDVVRQTVAREGAKGLYRGVSAPLTGVTPMCMWWSPFLAAVGIND